jgi:hypothetical protein
LVAPVLLACAALALATTSASAHHAFNAEYDEGDRVALKGTVAELEWTNPHSRIVLAVQRADGAIAKWEVELGTPGMLASRGVRRDDLRIGAQVAVDGYRARNKALAAAARILTLPDGTELFVR